MGCRQAFEIDLAGFLDEPRAEPFDVFRAHYPRCAVCAAEVRVWTELHEQLVAARHPTPEVLVGYAELPAAERVAVDRHTAQCPACREELRLLAAFDPAVLVQPAVAGPVSGERDGWTRALARIFWQPAFAYGVAVLVLLPILWRTQGPGRFAEVPAVPRGEEVAELRADSPRARPAQRTPPVRASVAKRATQPAAKGDVAEEGVVTSSPPLPLAALEDTGRAVVVPSATIEQPEPVAAFEREVAPRRSAAERVEAAAPAEREMAAAQQRKSALSLRAATDADALRASASAPRFVDELAAEEAAFAAVEAVTAVSTSLVPIALASAPEQVPLRVPVAAGAWRSVEIEVSDAQGTRALRQRAEVMSERGEVVIELPRAWLSPGQYRIELYDGDAPMRVFALPVVAR
ncbi:MAG: hypothetical protein JRH16_14050 [Deltaproteobacteria bacterium]|nr:hypothetical protein [Deltaproteobacteria bacterium]